MSSGYRWIERRQPRYTKRHDKYRNSDGEGGSERGDGRATQCEDWGTLPKTKSLSILISSGCYRLGA